MTCTDAEVRSALVGFMRQAGFAFMSHEEYACMALGHQVAAGEGEYNKKRFDTTPCYCLDGPVEPCEICNVPPSGIPAGWHSPQCPRAEEDPS